MGLEWLSQSRRGCSGPQPRMAVRGRSTCWCEAGARVGWVVFPGHAADVAVGLQLGASGLGALRWRPFCCARVRSPCKDPGVARPTGCAADDCVGGSSSILQLHGIVFSRV